MREPKPRARRSRARWVEAPQAELDPTIVRSVTAELGAIVIVVVERRNGTVSWGAGVPEVKGAWLEGEASSIDEGKRDAIAALRGMYAEINSSLDVLEPPHGG